MPSSSGDRLCAAIEGLIDHLLEPRVDYLASYPARVVLQNDDDSIEVAPDDARLPGLSRVPIVGCPV
jgi:hypothetical protein